jgi:hypothetical protein
MCIGEPRLRLAVGNCPRAPLERTFDDGALHAFALKGRIQILDTLFDVGAAHLDIRLQVAITFRKRGNLFLATRKRCFADLQCLGQSVVALYQCGSCLFVIFDLSFARLVRGFYLGQPLFRIVAGDHRLDRFAIESTNFFCSGDKILSRFRQQSLGGCGTRLQCIEPHVQVAAFRPMLLFGFVEDGTQSTALGIGFGKT